MLTGIRRNPIMLTDCYNTSHEFFKCNTDFEVSHMYNRAKGQILYGFNENILEILKIQVTKEMVDEAEEHAKRMGLMFPKDMWMRVVNEFSGYLPLRIQAVPEGLWCPKGTPFAQIRNTVEGFGELVTWLEGILMMAYFPSSCATRAAEMKKYLVEKQKEHGFDDSFLWRFHSFGFRGHKSLEDAYWAGTAWSMFLQGSDDFHIARHMPHTAMGSIGALAHKVTQQFDQEMDCFTKAIDATAEQGKNIVALVIDTYDAERVINEYVAVLARYAKAKGVHLVFRPDSGDVMQQAIDIYNVAKENSLTNVSVIIGEGMSFENAKKADMYFERNGVPLNFIAYGIGAGFYKDIERDTLGWAMKTAFSNGQPRMKVVKSDPFKQSIPGIVSLAYDPEDENQDMTVFSEDEVDKQDIQELLYDEVYSFNGKGIPYFAQAGTYNFKKVPEFALLNWEQEKIKLSKETQRLINEITSKYIGE